MSIVKDKQGALPLLHPRYYLAPLITPVNSPLRPGASVF